MFWFLFSWFIGRWGPKISCTKTQTFPNLGFLIPLIMSQVSNCLVLGRLFSHITASQHYPTIFNQLHKIESLPHRVGSSYVCASILCKFCLFLIFTWLTSHCVCVWVDKRVTNEAHHVVKVMNWWCYDMRSLFILARVLAGGPLFSTAFGPLKVANDNKVTRWVSLICEYDTFI